MKPMIKKGQLWQEADTRHIRVVRVLEVGDDAITIITERDSYKASRGYRPTKARIDRFKAGRRTSHCGYFLIKDAPEDQVVSDADNSDAGR